MNPTEATYEVEPLDGEARTDLLASYLHLPSRHNDVLLDLMRLVHEIGTTENLLEFLDGVSEVSQTETCYADAAKSVRSTTAYFQYAGETYCAERRSTDVPRSEFGVPDEMFCEYTIRWVDEDEIEHFIDPCSGRFPASIVDIDDALNHQQNVL
jgi:hypothetical protein